MTESRSSGAGFTGADAGHGSTSRGARHVQTRWQAALTMASAGLYVFYPLAAYFGLRHASPRVAAAILLVLMAPMLHQRLRQARRADLRPLMPLPLVMALALLSALLMNSAGGLLFAPVLVSALLMITFGWTLLRPPPLIERFARLVDADLSSAERAWCRSWTALWTGFFFLNGAIALLLAWQQNLVAWTTYNGLISYLILGTLVALEYCLRKVRFGRFRNHWFDRQLQRLRSHRRNQP